MTQGELIHTCFNAHANDIGGVNFSFEEYKSFWAGHSIGAIYEMKNKNGSTVRCKIAYYPLPYYKDLRALIEIDNITWTDYREVPVVFLKKIAS